MTLKIYDDLEQGSDEWLQARCGLLTASEIRLMVTPSTYKKANNEKLREHIWELAGQRITDHVEPTYIGEAMLRGHRDEALAREIYKQHYSADIKEVGFITNDKWGFTMGFSPDWLVGNRGFAECKSRNQKYQAKVIATGEIDKEHYLQVQGGMLIAERHWCDYVSYSGGMPMFVLRVMPDPEVQAIILEAAAEFHVNLDKCIEEYNTTLKKKKYIMTERIEENDGDIILTGDEE